MSKVYILTHALELPDGCEELKILGVYESLESAEAARSRAQHLPGFKDFPAGLWVEAYEVGRDQWPEGFVILS